MNVTIPSNEISLSSRYKVHSYGIGDPQMLMFITRDRIYRNPLRAAVQEYLSNARDANREANRESEPVKIELPDQEFGTSDLCITDHGVGISEYRMGHVFVQYGVSTKRNSDTQTGGYGLGCKTGFAYGDSFTVESVWDRTSSVNNGETLGCTNADFETVKKEGLEGSLTVEKKVVRYKDTWYHYIGKDGVCDYTKLASVKVSNEVPTGTTVKIPMAETTSEIAELIVSITKHWEVRPECARNLPYPSMKPAVIGPDTSPHKWVLYSGERDSDGKTIVRQPEFIIDGIPYTVQESYFRHEDERTQKFLKAGVTVYFNNREIAVTASREDIDYKPATVEYVSTILQQIAGEFQVRITEMAKALNPRQLFLFGYQHGLDELSDAFPSMKEIRVSGPLKLGEWYFSGNKVSDRHGCFVRPTDYVVIRDVKSKFQTRMTMAIQKINDDRMAHDLDPMPTHGVKLFVISKNDRRGITQGELDEYVPLPLLEVPTVIRLKDMKPNRRGRSGATGVAGFNYTGTARVATIGELSDCDEKYRGMHVVQLNEVLKYKGAILVIADKGGLKCPYTDKRLNRDVANQLDSKIKVVAVPRSRLELLPKHYTQLDKVVALRRQRADNRAVMGSDYCSYPDWMKPVAEFPQLLRAQPAAMELVQRNLRNRIMKAHIKRFTVLSWKHTYYHYNEPTLRFYEKQFPLFNICQNREFIKLYLNSKLNGTPITIKQIEKLLMPFPSK